MTYQDLVNKLKSNFEGMDAGRVREHLAIQFNVAGEAEGALYMEIKDGKVAVEPYEYYDRDILVFVETDALLAIADGQITIVDAFKDGKFYAEGNLGKVELLDSLSKKAADRREAEKNEVSQQEVVAEVTEEVTDTDTENKAESEVEVSEAEAETEMNVSEVKASDESQVELQQTEEGVKVEPAVKTEAVVEEKKKFGKKTPSRKLRKAAAKKNSKKR